MRNTYSNSADNFDRANISPKRLKQIWLLPLIFFQSYLLFMTFIFFFGPWRWPIDNGRDLFLYLTASQAFIAVGYLFSWNQVQKCRAKVIEDVIDRNVMSGLRFLKISLILTLVMFIPTSLSRTGSIFPDVINGLNNTGYAYNDTAKLIDGNRDYVLVEYIRIMVSPLLIGVIPLTIVHWGGLSKIWKALSLLSIIGFLSIYIGTGTNKGLAEFIVLTPWFYYLIICIGQKSRTRSRWLVAAGIALLFIAFLQFFNAGQLQRSGMVGETGVMFDGRRLIRSDSRALENVLSEGQIKTYVSFTRYLSTGYYALALSFEVDTPSTLGLGNSMFLARNADAIFDTDFFTQESIPGKLERQLGFPQFGLWHSIYPWLASDFGYGGSLVIMAIFAYIFGISWGYSVISMDHRWIILLSLMFVLFFYISANNQVFQSGETCIGFFATIGMIYFSKIRKIA